MIYYVSFYLKQYLHIFSLLHAIGIRSIAALITSFLLSLFFGKWFIKQSHSLFTSEVREYTPSSHQAKRNTPTMGGIFIIASIITTILLWSNFFHTHIVLFITCLLLFSIIGGIDDWKKIRKTKGVSVNTKFRLQMMCALTITIILFKSSYFFPTLTLPFFSNYGSISLGWLFIPWAMFIIIGSSNAVNLTDGLDGLATTVLIPNYALFAILCYFSGQSLLSLFLGMPLNNISELTIACAAVCGSLLGFLWYNTYPAQVFMGDIGSLPLGASLGLLALISKKEFMLAFSGAIFVVETLSVIAQILSVKLRKKRLFAIAPLHHHFETRGLHESTITTRCGIITLLLCFLCLLTLNKW